MIFCLLILGAVALYGSDGKLDDVDASDSVPSLPVLTRESFQNCGLTFFYKGGGTFLWKACFSKETFAACSERSVNEALGASSVGDFFVAMFFYGLAHKESNGQLKMFEFAPFWNLRYFLRNLPADHEAYVCERGDLKVLRTVLNKAPEDLGVCVQYAEAEVVSDGSRQRLRSTRLAIGCPGEISDQGSPFNSIWDTFPDGVNYVWSIQPACSDCDLQRLLQGSMVLRIPSVGVDFVGQDVWTDAAESMMGRILQVLRDCKESAAAREEEKKAPSKVQHSDHS